MALLHQVCSIPLARASIRSRAFALTISCRSIVSSPSATTSAVTSINTTPSKLPEASPARASLSDSRVLLGMSEQELQQLAIEFGQVKTKLKEVVFITHDFNFIFFIYIFFHSFFDV